MNIVSRRPAEIHWEGDSKEILSGFPGDVKLSLGYSLRRLQNGEFPVAGVIHVLHCFEKESRKTDQPDAATARARLKQVLNRIGKEKNR